MYAVRIQFLYISNNPLREIQNNVFAPLTKLSSLTIIPSRHTLKHIQSYAFNASSLQSLSLSDAHFKFRHQTFDPDNIFHFCPWLHTLILSYNSVPSDSETAIRMFGPLRRLKKLVLFAVGWDALPGDLLISQLENFYNVCTTYAHVLPLEQELVFRVPIPCPHHNKLRIHHIHSPYY
jgi:hypothetical protein